MILRPLFFIILISLFLSLYGRGSDPDNVQKRIKTAYSLEKKCPDTAMNLFREAIALSDEYGIINDSLVNIRLKICEYEYYRGNTEIAVSHALKALIYYQKTNKIQESVRVLTLIGDILRGNGLYEQSYYYLQRAQILCDKSNSGVDPAPLYNRLAALYYEYPIIPLDSSEKYAVRSLDIAKSQGKELLIYNNLNILGSIKAKRNRFNEAEKYLNEALPLAKKVYPLDEPLVLINLGYVYYRLRYYSKAEETLLKAINLAGKYNIPQYIRLASLHLVELYKFKKDYKKAFGFDTLYFNNFQYIVKQKVLVQLKEFNFRMESEKQKSENQRLIYEQKLTEGRMNTYLYLGLFLFILLLVMTTFYFYQRRQKIRTRLMASELEQTNKIMKRFISILAHDLRSPFNSILGFTDLLNKDHSMTKEDREFAVNRLNSASHSAFQLLESLLEWSRLHSGAVRPMNKECDLNEMVRNTIHLLEPASALKNIRIVLSGAETLSITADPDMIKTVIRNILSNSIKYTHQGGLIGIHLGRETETAQIEFTDNGTGIQKEILDKLFRLAEDVKTPGTDGEKGTGLGMIICKEIIDKHGGTIEISSEPGKGTNVLISLPLRS